jgi:hypothetical protein
VLVTLLRPLDRCAGETYAVCDSTTADVDIDTGDPARRDNQTVEHEPREEPMPIRDVDSGDEGNGSFELPELALENTKPGMTYEDEAARKAKPAEGPGEEGSDRFPRRQRTDIPQESLAARIRKASKGG